MLKYLFVFLLLIAANPFAFAQTPEATTAQATTANSSEVQMADVLRQDGKIYVVVAVIVTVLVGLLIYLVRLDRKVAKLEQQLRS